MDDGIRCLLLVLTVAVAAAIYVYLRKYFNSRHDHVTEEELKTMVTESQEQGVLETSEAEMIANIFAFDEKDAGDIMTHRKNIIALDGAMTLKDAAGFVLKESINSRFPVYGKDLDDIIGTVHIRDVLVHAEDEREGKMQIAMIPGLMREAHFIPETRSINDLFKEMQSQKIHMEIVVDEYGQTAGIVTMEDILEEIVGNILDEYDKDEPCITRGSGDTLIMTGMTPLEEVEQALDIQFPEEDLENFDTLNGLLISRLARIPGDEEKPEVDYMGYHFSVLKIKNKMIESASVRCMKPTETNA